MSYSQATLHSETPHLPSDLAGTLSSKEKRKEYDVKLVRIFDSGAVGVTVLASFSLPSSATGHQVGGTSRGAGRSKGAGRGLKEAHREATKIVVKRVNRDDPEPKNFDRLRKANIPHTVTMFGQYKNSERYKYIVMEFLPGGNLTSHSTKLSAIMQSKNGRLGFSEPLVRHWMTFVVVFLERIHAIGLACRDLKPDNLLLTLEGGIKVGDWSIEE